MNETVRRRFDDRRWDVAGSLYAIYESMFTLVSDERFREQREGDITFEREETQNIYMSANHMTQTECSTSRLQ